MEPTHIVLTTDFSEEAARPLGAIGDFARRVGAKVTLLHVSQILTGPMQRGPKPLPPSESGERTTAEQALAEVAKGFPEGVRVDCRVVAATDVADGIVAEAAELRASLIALSTHGRTGLRRVVLGSVAENVLRHARAPVLCFPPPRGEAPERLAVDHMLVTTDGSEAALRPFAPVFALARAFGSRVTVLNVAEEEHPIVYGAPPLGPPLAAPLQPQDAAHHREVARKAIEAQCKPLAGGMTPTVVVLDHEDPAEAIVRYAADGGADLIALSTHGRTGFRRLVFGSVAEEVLRHSPVPVLTFPRIG